MYKHKLMLPIIVLLFCFLIGSVAAIDNNDIGENLTNAEGPNSPEQLNSIEETPTLSSDFNESDMLKKSDLNDHLSIVNESNSDEKLCIDYEAGDVFSMPVNSSANVLSTAVSVSSSQGHIYNKGGYIFKVSQYQYKKINQAINAGKKQKFLDYGFKFTVKTNKLHIYKKPFYQTKKVVKYKWVYKTVRVSQEKYWYWEYRFDTDRRATSSGWECYKLSETDFEYGVPHTHYVHFKKKVKYVGTQKVKTGKYQNIVMRVYANINYVGEYDYVTGQHAFFPWVSFIAMKSGYKNIYLDGLLLLR